MDDRTKRIRLRAGYTQIQAAVLAGVSLVTWRLWEANQNAISPRYQDKCKAATLAMAKKIPEVA